MNLRRRGYLTEAQYKRDKEVRDTAESFYKAFLKFAKNRSDELVPRKDGGLSVHAMEFWKHPKARRFGVVLTPGQSGLGGGIGIAGKSKVLVLPVLVAPLDAKHLVARVSSKRDVIVHEMAHFLDPGFDKGGGVERYRKGTGPLGLNMGSYYNDPAEWNAFWHEGAAAFERMLHWDVITNPAVRDGFIGDGSLGQARARAGKMWDKGFLLNMNPKTRRKFDKRFAQLWSAAKAKGLL